MEDLINKIITLREEGKTLNFISKELKISTSKLSRLIKENNIPNKLFNFKDPKIIESLLKVLKNNKYSTQQEISDLLKIKHYQLNRIIKINKLEEIFNKNKENIEKSKKNKSESVKRLKKRYKKLLVEYKGGKCEKCGYNKCIEALEFHHLDPQKKEFGLGANSRSLEIQKKEADKCILVCSNCHREIHYG